MAIKKNPFAKPETPVNNISRITNNNNFENNQESPSSQKVSTEKKRDEFDELMEESEEEVLLRKKRESGNQTFAKKKEEESIALSSQDQHTGEQLIEQSRNYFISQHKGIKSARYITYEILQQLNENFFSKYYDAAIDASDKILNIIVDSDNNDISEARDNPTDESLQEKGYKTLYGAMYEYLQKNHTDLNKSVMMGMIVNEVLGFGIIDPLWRERKIDEILCNGPYDIQVEIKGGLKKVQAAKFRDKEHMYSLLEKLFSSINKSVSQMSPIVDGRLHDKSRMAVVHHVAAPEGPNFSIRRHPEEYWTPEKLIGYKSATKEMLTDLGNWINKGCSVLCVGGTGTGKTSTLNTLSGFIENNLRIITLEDNIEMMLNPNKFKAAAMEVVPPKPDRPNDAGISMRDLVKASLRLRPDGIILGEVRDAAAYELIQALNTGHWGFSTVHANSSEDAMGRLASLSAQSGLTTIEAELGMIASAFDLVVLIKRYPSDGSRKIVSIEEVGIKPELGKDGEPHLPTYPLWEFIESKNTDPTDPVIRGHWEKVRNISDIRTARKSLDLSPDKNWEELLELCKIK